MDLFGILVIVNVNVINHVTKENDCKCECDKSCDIGEYLDCKNCKR